MPRKRFGTFPNYFPCQYFSFTTALQVPKRPKVSKASVVSSQVISAVPRWVAGTHAQPPLRTNVYSSCHSSSGQIFPHCLF